MQVCIDLGSQHVLFCAHSSRLRQTCQLAGLATTCRIGCPAIATSASELNCASDRDEVIKEAALPPSGDRQNVQARKGCRPLELSAMSIKRSSRDELLAAREELQQQQRLRWLDSLIKQEEEERASHWQLPVPPGGDFAAVHRGSLSSDTPCPRLGPSLSHSEPSFSPFRFLLAGERPCLSREVAQPAPLVTQVAPSRGLENWGTCLVSVRVSPEAKRN